MSHIWVTDVVKGVSHFERGPAYGVKVWRDGKPFHFKRIYGGVDGRARRGIATKWANAVRAKGLAGYEFSAYVGSSFPEAQRTGWKD